MANSAQRGKGRTVWVGYQTPAPDSIQRVEPQEIRVFATEALAQAWVRELRVTATSPLRSFVSRQVENGRAPEQPHHEQEAGDA